MWRKLLTFAFGVIAGIVATRIDNHLITPVIPHLPGVPMLVYGVIVYAVAVLVLLGMILAAWLVCRQGWRVLTQEEVRRDSWEKVRQWPTSKWDLALPVTMAYSAGFMVPMITAMLVIPGGRLAGTVAPTEFLVIFWVAIAPLFVALMPFTGRSLLETYRDVKRRWVVGTRKQKTILAIVLIAAVLVLLMLMIGDLVGWDDMLFADSP